MLLMFIPDIITLIGQNVAKTYTLRPCSWLPVLGLIALWPYASCYSPEGKVIQGCYTDMGPA